MGHLENAARLASRKNNFSYYCYHAWVAIRTSAELMYIGIMSFIHAFIPNILTDYASKELNSKTRKELFDG